MIRTVKNIARKFIPTKLFKAAQPYYHGILATGAHYCYGKPSDKLIVIGVTGTKGKTSTAHIIYQTLNQLTDPHPSPLPPTVAKAMADKGGREGGKASGACGLVTTAVIDDGSGQRMNEFRMTQMSGPVTHNLLAHMVKAGKKYAVVEVSSEGLAQHRHLGINFDIAVFTNLTPDHVDAHGSFDAYKEAKGILFRGLNKLKVTSEKLEVNPNLAKTIVSNLDSEYGLYYLNFKADKHITYAIDNQTATIVARNLTLASSGSQLQIADCRLQINLPGKFNIYNALAAVGVAESLGFDMQSTAKSIEQLGPIPGRMEALQSEPFTVLVDYAHEKASMTALYETVKGWPHKRIIQVFGATGGVRDKSRRTDLGTLAGKFTDIAIITDEDPFDEDPQTIIHDIADKAVAEGKIIGQTLFRNPDRRGAIAKALTLAQAGDLVLITGKGAEQKIARANGQYEDWDDRTVAREEISRLQMTSSSTVAKAMADK